MRIKKCMRWGLVVVLIAGMSMVLKDTANNCVILPPTPVEPSEPLEESSPLTQQEEEGVLKATEQLLEDYVNNHMILVDLKKEKVEKDSYGRYFIKLHGIGIKSSEDIDLYNYYVILQRDTKEELYAMPFGIEVKRKDTNRFTEDVMISMFKMINGWEMTESDMQKKWEHLVKEVSFEFREDHHLDGASMHALQEVIYFINQYMETYLNPVEVGNLSQLEDYYAVSEGLEDEQKTKVRLDLNKVRTEVLNSKVMHITIDEITKRAYVLVEVGIRAYEVEAIKDYEFEVLYELEMHPVKGLIILNETKRLK